MHFYVLSNPVMNLSSDKQCFPGIARTWCLLFDYLLKPRMCF